jgi:hypothetical protein
MAKIGSFDGRALNRIGSILEKQNLFLWVPRDSALGEFTCGSLDSIEPPGIRPYSTQGRNKHRTTTEDVGKAG